MIKFLTFASYLSFNLKPKCFQCTNELALLLQNFWRGISMSLYTYNENSHFETE